MVSKSKKQARTMAGAARDPAFARKMGIPQKVAREFHEADKGTGILEGKRGFSTKKKKVRKGGK